MNKKNRIAAINDVYGTGKFISLTLTEGLKPGSQINISINGDTLSVEPVEISDEKISEYKEKIEAFGDLEKEIGNQGYVKNNHLYRRWVMAQMFKMLNYADNWNNEEGYDAYLRHYNWKYQFRVLENEINAMYHMERENDPELEIRSSFWTKEVIAATIKDFARRLDKYVSYNCKGKYFIDGRYVSRYDLDMIINKINNFADIITKVNDWFSVKSVFKQFSYITKKYKLGKETPFCPEWKDAFKGAGAYYTLQNLVRYHGVGIKLFDKMFYGKAAENILETQRLSYKGNGYKLFYFMKDVIDYNHFDFAKRMNEIYANR